MEIVLRLVPHAAYESVKTDAISCTYDMDGFTLMNAVLSELGLDREHFRKCANLHADGRFRVISHGEEKPFVITTTRTERWDSQLDATEQILNTADAERCTSLCMTHFAFILGVFPEAAFTQCLQYIEQAKHLTQLKRVVVDVDERFVDAANAIRQKVKAQLDKVCRSEGRGNGCADPYHLVLGLGSAAQRLILRYQSEATKDRECGNLHIAAKDSFVTGLDCSDFDRFDLQALLDGAAKVLVVVCAGGWAGTEMAKFSVQHAVAKKIPIEALLSLPFDWEGQRRQTRALSLADDLRATGAEVTVVESSPFYSDDVGWEEQFIQLDRAILNDVSQWCSEHA